VVGDNTISIVVTAEDGTTTRTYTIVVTRDAAPPPPPPLGTDASLSSLSLSDGTLGPAFSPAVTSYTVTVPNSTDSVDVSATTSDSNASFTINGGTNATIALVVGDNTISIVVTAEDGTTTRTYTIVVTRPPSGAQEAYIKASNTDSGDIFGYAVALSGDGNTLAVGATYEDSNATGLNGDQANNDVRDAGAVYVFTRDSGGSWTQQAYIKASNTGWDDQFGWSVALSGDGNTLVAGAIGESSAATGVNGTQADNSASYAGAVYVFTRDTGGVWTQQAYVKASNTDAFDAFGSSVALSAGGNILAVGAVGEDSAATGVNGHPAGDASASGAVYVFTRDSGSVWTQQVYVKASNTDVSDNFGWSVDLSGDGSTLAVGAINEDSAAIGVNGNQANDSVRDSGAAYVFTRDSGGVWTQQAYVKASNTDVADFFGWSVALSGDGSTLAVAADGEDSAGTGVNGAQADNNAPESGAVYVFTHDSGGVWTQQAYAKASNTDADDSFGSSVALSDDGTSMAVGVRREDSAATDVNGNQADNSALDAGAVCVFTRDSGDTWTQQIYVKASNTDAFDFFGWSVALTGDGNTLAVGAAGLEFGILVRGESSAATGVNEDQTDNSASAAGVVYVFR
jgi:hypothetical protein